VITYRSGSGADARILFEIFEAAIDDLGARMQASANSTASDPDAWERRRPLFEHLARTGTACGSPSAMGDRRLRALDRAGRRRRAAS
jgi:hypothetical protein